MAIKAFFCPLILEAANSSQTTLKEDAIFLAVVFSNALQLQVIVHLFLAFLSVVISEELAKPLTSSEVSATAIFYACRTNTKQMFVTATGMATEMLEAERRTRRRQLRLRNFPKTKPFVHQ